MQPMNGEFDQKAFKDQILGSIQFSNNTYKEGYEAGRRDALREVHADLERLKKIVEDK